MNTPAKFLGMVRVWQEGDEWRWRPLKDWAPEHAVMYLSGEPLRLSIGVGVARV